VIASFVEALGLDDGDLLVVIAPPHTVGIISDYALRWGIETLFGIFKTRGFCLESTHFTDPDRLRPTFCSVNFSFGLVSLKKHGRRAKSLFRLGFDHPRHLILNPFLPNHQDFLHSLQFLSCT